MPITSQTMSAATPAFAKINCNETQTVCSGGSGCGRGVGCPPGSANDVPGGDGGHDVTGPAGNVVFSSGGGGGQIPTTGGVLVGGAGRHFNCDATLGSCPDPVGGSGQHIQGPGGNLGK